MKKVYFLFLLTLIIPGVLSQAPAKISCQAIVRDSQNNLLNFQNVGIEISIMGGSETGHLVFRERHETVTNAHGIINFEIGSGIISAGNLSSIKWSMGPFFIKTAIDPSGGDDYSLETVSQFNFVPYAMYSDVAFKILEPIVEVQTLSEILALGDSAGSKITGLIDPTEDGDLITFQYLLNLLSSVVDSNVWSPAYDIENNSYRTIRVGRKIWMAENLRTGTYNDGTAIPLVTGSAAWTALNTPGYCWYDNSYPNVYPSKVYGALYNWYTIHTEKLCPSGWRIPDNNEWDELIEAFGGTDVAGGLLKENGTKHWILPNITQGGISSFKALPGGYRTDDFYGQGAYSKFWSSNEVSVSSANSLSLDSPSDNAGMVPSQKKTGLSVRCVKDGPLIIR